MISTDDAMANGLRAAAEEARRDGRPEQAERLARALETYRETTTAVPEDAAGSVDGEGAPATGARRPGDEVATGPGPEPAVEEPAARKPVLEEPAVHEPAVEEPSAAAHAAAVNGAAAGSGTPAGEPRPAQWASQEQEQEQEQVPAGEAPREPAPAAAGMSDGGDPVVGAGLDEQITADAGEPAPRAPWYTGHGAGRRRVDAGAGPDRGHSGGQGDRRPRPGPAGARRGRRRAPRR
jgi:hypothetical protein